MDSIKLLGFAHAEVLHFGGDNTQSVFFKTAVNFADYIFTYSIGFNDGDRALNSHIMSLFLLRCAIV